MHCPICDREDSLITFDKTTGKFGDCTVCKEVIDDCLADFDDEEPDETLG